MSSQPSLHPIEDMVGEIAHMTHCPRRAKVPGQTGLRIQYTSLAPFRIAFIHIVVSLALRPSPRSAVPNYRSSELD